MPLSPAVVTGIGAAGQAIQGASGIIGQFMANKANKKLAQESMEFEQKMWEQSNAYNSPAAQMKRLQDAGLNPNLVYGSGSVAGNTSPASQPRAVTPQMQNVVQGLSVEPLSIIGQYQTIKNQKAQEDLTRKNIEYLDQKKINESLNYSLNFAKMTGLNLDNRSKRQLYEYSGSMLAQDLKAKQLANQGTLWNLYKMNPLELQIKQNLLKQGVADIALKNAELKLKNAMREKNAAEISRLTTEIGLIKEYGYAQKDLDLKMGKLQMDQTKQAMEYQKKGFNLDIAKTVLGGIMGFGNLMKK